MPPKTKKQQFVHLKASPESRELDTVDSSIVPPITSLVWDIYSISSIELQRLKQRQRLIGRAGLDEIEVRKMRDWVGMISTAHKMESEEERRSRLSELSDEELMAHVAEARALFAGRND